MRYNSVKRFIGLLCFTLFGIVATFQQGKEFDPWYLLYGAVVGFAFGWISMFILALLLRLINPGLRKIIKNGFARKAVAQGMVFMVPFAVTAFMAAYFLHWRSATLFISAGISAVAIAIGEEIGKLYGKPKLWNNIVPSVVASACSLAWLYLIVQIQTLPGTVISLYQLAMRFMSVKP